MRWFRALALAVTLLAPAPARAEGPQEAAAVVRFTKGRELFMANKFDAALVEFRAANELFASPNTRLYIARCERELGHPGTAFTEFQRAASDAADRARTDPKYSTTRDIARTEAQSLEGKFGRLLVKAKEPGISVTVNGAPLPPAALGVPTPFDPGNIEIAATAKGKLPFKQKVPLKAGETSEVAIALESDPAQQNVDAPPPPPQPEVHTETPPPATESPQPKVIVERSGGGVRLASYFVVAASLAGFIGFAVMGATAQGQFNQLQDLSKKPPVPADWSKRVDEGERNQTIANVMLGVGIGCAVVGGLMFALGGETTTTRSARARPVFSFGPSGGYLGVARAF